MRKFSYLLVVLFSFFMFSCSRDEDNKTNVPAQPQQLDSVVGNWALVEMRMKGNITVGGGVFGCPGGVEYPESIDLGDSPHGVVGD